MNVAYTNHIGRSSRDTHSGKNTAISTLKDLAATERHNNHDYTAEDISRMESCIDLELKELNAQYIMRDGELVKIDGHLDLEANVRKIYEEQFSAAVAKYNKRQVEAGHPERQIDSYIEKISNSKQQEVAVEGLIQFGNFENWEDMTLEDRKKVAPILLKCLEETLSELKTKTGEFILAGASLHMNEGTPHIHYVGVPVEETPDAKYGIERRVRKSAVFNRDSLGEVLQDSVRAKIEPELKKVLGWEFEEKQTGRNEDLGKNRYVNNKLQKQIHEAEQRLNDIELTIHEAMNNLEQDLQEQTQRAVEVAADDRNGAYSNVLFLMDACSDERFEELDKEGKQLKKAILGEIVNEDPPAERLEDLIRDIASGKKKPRELSWEERKARFAACGTVANDFWAYRKDLMERYDTKITEKYDERKLVRQAHNDAVSMLYQSRNIVTSLIATAWAMSSAKKEKLINQQIAEVRKERAAVIRCTQDFVKFNRAYRDDLKAGKIPCEKFMDAMAGALTTLEEERQKFLEQDGKERKHQLFR